MRKFPVFSVFCLAVLSGCDLWNLPLTRSAEEAAKMLQIREIYVAELPSPNVFASDETWPKTAEEWAAKEFGLVVYAVDGFDKVYPIEAGEHYMVAGENPEYDDQANLTKITVTLQLAENKDITTDFEITLYPAEEKYYKIEEYVDTEGKGRVIAYPSMAKSGEEVTLYVYPASGYTIAEGPVLEFTPPPPDDYPSEIGPIKKFTMIPYDLQIKAKFEYIEDKEAKVNGIFYYTLATAIADAENGDTVTALRDIVLTDGVAIDKDVTLTAGNSGVAITRGKDLTDSLFTVKNGASLTLEGNAGNKLIIDGGKEARLTANAALITVEDGTLTINEGTVLQNNANTGQGGGVYVGRVGVLTMTGGAISGNTASNGGGGVWVDGEFTMSGNAVVREDNDVGLATGKAVTVGKLDGSGLVAKIRPTENTSDGTAVLKPAGSPLTAGIINRFTLGIPNRAIILEGGNGVLRMPVSILQNGSTVYFASIQRAIDATGEGGTADSLVMITVNGNITIDDTIKLENGKHIKLAPGNGTRTISRGSAGGDLFTVNDGASLTLEGDSRNELIIDGDNISASGSLVDVGARGTFTMHDGSVLQNNNNNTQYEAGGVYVHAGATFNMEGGTISGNTGRSGGGVCADGGNITMSGGTISGNTGEDGGGVYIRAGATFTMTDGCIEGNTSVNGGGVNVGSNGGTDITFNFEGGVIQNNTATSTGYGGGGITVVRGTVNMYGTAVIRANTANGKGGGVAVQYAGSFKKTGGNVYGANNADDANHAYGGGHALYLEGGTVTIGNESFTDAGTSWNNTL